jgi:hypothetical protein
MLFDFVFFSSFRSIPTDDQGKKTHRASIIPHINSFSIRGISIVARHGYWRCSSPWNSVSEPVIVEYDLVPSQPDG